MPQLKLLRTGTVFNVKKRIWKLRTVRVGDVGIQACVLLLGLTYGHKADILAGDILDFTAYGSTEFFEVRKVRWELKRWQARVYYNIITDNLRIIQGAAKRG